MILKEVKYVLNYKLSGNKSIKMLNFRKSIYKYAERVLVC